MYGIRSCFDYDCVYWADVVKYQNVIITVTSFMTIFAFYTERIPSQLFYNITNNEFVIVFDNMEVILLSGTFETTDFHKRLVLLYLFTKTIIIYWSDWCVRREESPLLMCSGPEKTKIRSSSLTRILDEDQQVRYLNITYYHSTQVE